LTHACSPIKMRVFGVAATMALFGCVSFLRGQTPHACGDDRPFTAKMTEITVIQMPEGTERKVEFRGVRARDSKSRVYAELHGLNRGVAERRTASPSDEARARVISGFENKIALHSVASLYDCHTEEDVTILPDLKLARVTRNREFRKWKAGESFFQYLTRGNRPPNVIVEDLGFKELEGVVTHGYRETVVGREDAGEWSGKTTWVMESWVSDDLAEKVLEVITDLKAKTEMTVKVTEIKWEEPPSSLFEIPSGYRVETPANDKPEDKK